MRFELMCHRWEFDAYRSQIWAALHGRSYVVILPDSPDVAWSGRLEVGDFIDNGTTATVYIVIHAQPYKIIPSSDQTLLDTSWIPNTGFGPGQITVPNDYPKHWFIFWADFQGQGTFDLPLLIDGELYTVKEVGRGRYWSPDDFWLDPGEHTIAAKPVPGVGGDAANLEIDVLGGCL